MSGHSKWANIKQKKGKQDAQRGKVFTKMTRDIIVAVKSGGPDVEGNFRLRIAVQNAKAVNMSNETIAKAIQRAAGQTENDNMEEIVYEGYGPAGMAIMLDILTDNRNRSAGDIRHLFSKYGGNLGETGCVGWMFKRVGIIEIEDIDAAKQDEITLIAIEAGADDIEFDEDYCEIITSPDMLETVARGLKDNGIEFASATITMLPETTVSLEGKDAEMAEKLMDALENHDDVQEAFSNIDDNE